MKVTLESTTKTVTLVVNGVDVPARVWEGTTEAGIPCHAFITRISVRKDLDAAEFARDLAEQREPSAEIQGIPLRIDFMSALSLWQIDKTIAQLLELLDDAKPEEIAPIQQELERYVGETLPAKVDGYIGIIRQDEAIADAAEAEADRLTKIAKARRERVAWLKNNAKVVMEARGLKRLEGSTGHRLRIQAAGGKQKLSITREDLVPDEYKRYELRMTYAQFNLLKRMYEDPGNIPGILIEDADGETIRKALEMKCAACGGMGRKQDTTEPCAECRGTGHQLVPGAELEPRSVSLRVE